LQQSDDEDFAFFAVFYNFWAFLLAIAADEPLAANQYRRAPYVFVGVHGAEYPREYCTLLAYTVHAAFEALGDVF